MIVGNQQELSEQVLRVMEQTEDPRLREIMVALVRHLHEFVREVRLSEEEFRTAAAIVARLGQLTTDTHNEVVLMAGSLGVSSLVCLLNNGNNGTSETSQNLLGPFWRLNSPRMSNGDSIVRSPTPGPVLFMTAQVVDQKKQPVAGAEVDIWQSSPAGYYENQDDSQVEMNLRGKFITDAQGRFWFRSVKPAGYPIPTDGVVGNLLKLQKRHPFRPAHVHALIFKPGLKTLISQVYAGDDPNLESDTQFGVTRALVGNFVPHHEPHPTVPDAGTPWYTLHYTFVMEPGEAKLPRPPIK
ncbi:MAG: catechol 1,2-dioxygenase [Alphaproteobacteria bacterium]|nr:catechol 1,2-dioxygenase [Alphaproteobacteria bacterium]